MRHQKTLRGDSSRDNGVKKMKKCNIEAHHRLVNLKSPVRVCNRCDRPVTSSSFLNRTRSCLCFPSSSSKRLMVEEHNGHRNNTEVEERLGVLLKQKQKLTKRDLLTCPPVNKSFQPFGGKFYESGSSPYLSDSDSTSDGTDGQSRSSSAYASSNATPEPHCPDLLLESYHLHHEISRVVGKDVYDIQEFGSVASFVNSRIECGLESASFLVTNLSDIVGQLRQWHAELPMVEPFYAVKCNPDPVILRLLASLGCNFDCATMGEIDLVLNGLGDDLSFGAKDRARSSIVYANPAKMENMIKFAMDNDVRMTVFDGEDELHKIASLGGHDKFDLLLRLTTDDKASICQFSKKFGCPVADAPHLLKVAKSLGLRVAGVSFHVGSGCGDADAYVTALSHALSVFESAEALGMPPMNIIDIGGGFPGDSGGYGGPGMPSFQDLALAIRRGIDNFAANLGRPLSEVRFIAEPGRYFVSASTVITTKVYSRKGGASNVQALYVDDGVYGSFNNVVYDHATPIPLRLSSVLGGPETDGALIPSAVFGPTCDGLDQMCSMDTTLLPRCAVGDWIIWENQGAYTHTASFIFNGYTHFPSKTYCFF